MKLVVLGSNGYRPTDLGLNACYAIPELGVILDAGTGIYRLVNYLLSNQLDSFITHAIPIFPRTEVAFDRMEIEF
jgi:ribonuclease Z